MELNRKILKIGLVLMAFILIASITVAFGIKLDTLVFLKSLVEEGITINEEYYQSLEFRISYISNSYDNRQVSYIEFLPEEYDGDKIYGNVLYDGFDNYGPYKVSTIHLEIHRDNIPRDLDRLEINRGKVNFNNGDIMEVDLGRIILHSREVTDNYFEFGTGSSSSDGSSSSTRDVKEDISLIELQSPLFEEARGLFDIKIDGVDYKEIQGIKYKKGDSLREDSFFKTPEDILDSYTRFELQPRLYFKDSKDNISFINILNIRHDPYRYDFREILKYLKARGEI